ncbi:hypothetical protein [Streptomyces sp. NPDC004658]|uniref:hypothetical protein n=1 Tax=Streptomyces sp. NPDC004658 TaxID=3154672 RepID=UPI0033A20CC5
MSQGPGGPAVRADLPQAERAGEDSPRPGARMAARPAGNAWLVHPAGELDQRSWMYAAGLAHDSEYTLVVVDIPPDASAGVLHDVLRALPPGERGVRLVFGRTPPGGTAQAGSWLAARSGRIVVTALGRPRPTSEGALFIGAEQGPGWMRYDPAGGAAWEGRRFPRPEWEHDLRAESWSAGRDTVAEPVPAGLWLRPTRLTPSLPRHRSLLMTRLAGRPDAVTVVVGAPGADAVPLTDVARAWWTLPEHLRTFARFVCFGPVDVPAGLSFSAALAAKVGVAVRTYNGLPVGPGPLSVTGGAVMTVGSDGTLGRPVMVRESVQFPPLATGAPRDPLVTDHHWPLLGLPLVRPGVYRYGSDAVVEVVLSGLWIRGARERPGTARRSAAPDERHELVLYDSADAGAREQLCRIAESLARKVSAEYGVPVQVRAVDDGPEEVPEVPPGRATPVSGPITGQALESVTAVAPRGAADAVLLPSAPAPTSGTASADVPGTVRTSGPRQASAAGPLPGVAGHPAPSPVPAGTPVPVSSRTPGPGTADTAPPHPPGDGAPGAVVDARLRNALGQRYEEEATFAVALLHRQPALLHGGPLADAVAELALLRFYVRDRGILSLPAQTRDDRFLHATLGLRLTAGLRRLPAFTGPVTVRVSLGDDDLAWYAAREQVVAQNCCAAVLSPTPGQPGNTDVVILSAGGRRTAMLEAGDPDVVLFPPGTAFAVLRVTRAGATGRHLILLRELDSPRDPEADRAALRRLERALAEWRRDESTGPHRRGPSGRFFQPPGLEPGGRRPG